MTTIKEKAEELNVFANKANYWSKEHLLLGVGVSFDVDGSTPWKIRTRAFDFNEDGYTSVSKIDESQIYDHIIQRFADLNNGKSLGTYPDIAFTKEGKKKVSGYLDDLSKIRDEGIANGDTVNGTWFPDEIDILQAIEEIAFGDEYSGIWYATDQKAGPELKLKKGIDYEDAPYMPREEEDPDAKKTYYASYKVTGNYYFPIEASSPKEAKRLAEEEMRNHDLNDLVHIDMDLESLTVLKK